MARSSAPAGEQTTPRFRVALNYALAGDLRYLSHHDELRMLTRALVRARWPLRYSRGFNPIPRLTLTLPRSVGTASECQLALVELREERAVRGLRDSLTATLPTGCTLKGLSAAVPRGKPHAVGVEYSAELNPVDARTIAPRVRALLQKAELTVQRARHDGRSQEPLDIRPLIETLVRDGSVLRMRLRIHQQRTARPSEILMALGLPAGARDVCVRRTEVIWDMELSDSGAGPTDPKDTDLGNTDEIDNHGDSKEEPQGEKTPASPRQGRADR